MTQLMKPVDRGNCPSRLKNTVIKRLAAAAEIWDVILAATAAIADNPKIVNSLIVLLHEKSYEVHITVGHVDTSKDHYVDQWEVIGPGREVLVTRVL